MDALDMAMRMWPVWLLGLVMVIVTIMSGNKDLIRIDKKAIFGWTKFLLFLTTLRAVGLYFIWDTMKDKFSAVSWIPWQSTTMVWWEDMAHTVPLFLLMRLIGVSRKTMPIHILAFLVTMFAFGAGHLYQGFWPALGLSFYIPMTMFIGNKKGFGTVMLGHVMYDLSTILLLQEMLRVM